MNEEMKSLKEALVKEFDNIIFDSDWQKLCQFLSDNYEIKRKV